MSHILETVMLIFFGLSWPLSILRSWRARSTKGKSLPFMIAIALGYAAGIAAKFAAAQTAGNQVSYVVAFYIVNLAMVCADIALYFRNRKLDGEAYE